MKVIRMKNNRKNRKTVLRGRRIALGYIVLKEYNGKKIILGKK